jgi:3-oxoacyl-[acyl-carrier protein] reductase
MARGFVKTLGLPIPLPQELDRPSTPWVARQLENRPVFVAHFPGAALDGVVAEILAGTGAEVWLDAPEETAAAYGKALSPKRLTGEQVPENVRPHALVFDATGIKTPEDLAALYAFFHRHVKGIAACGRAVVLVRAPEDAGDVAAAVSARAVEGFVRSLAREIGRKGATANMIYVEAGAEERAGAVLWYLLSARSAYISGQPIRVSARGQAQPAVFAAPLQDKVAIVTGAARGIGEATARTLAREGAKVIIVDRPEDQELAGKVAEAIGGTLFAADISSPDTAGNLATMIKEKFGHLDIVVHNAGITRDKTLGNMDNARWDQVLNVNLISLMRLNEALIPHFREGGRIICLSSVGGIAGNMGQTNYAASKAGVIGYVQALAPVLADRGITANAIAPGFIETRMTAAIPVATREVGRRLSNLSQGGQPSDVAEAITFLASPGAAGVTGQVLRVCGGNYLGA